MRKHSRSYTHCVANQSGSEICIHMVVPSLAMSLLITSITLSGTRSLFVGMIARGGQAVIIGAAVPTLR